MMAINLLAAWTLPVRHVEDPAKNVRGLSPKNCGIAQLSWSLWGESRGQLGSRIHRSALRTSRLRITAQDAGPRYLMLPVMQRQAQGMFVSVSVYHSLVSNPLFPSPPNGTFPAI